MGPGGAIARPEHDLVEADGLIGNSTGHLGALHLGRVATPFSLKGAANDTQGVMRASGVYLREDGGVGTLSQVDLKV